MRTCVCVCVCVLLQMLFIVFFLLLLGEKKRETKDVNRAPNIREKKKKRRPTVFTSRHHYVNRAVIGLSVAHHVSSDDSLQ